MINPVRLNADSRLSFLLHTITGFLRLCLCHYYGVICHLASNFILSFLLMKLSWLSLIARTIQGFPSYLWLPVSNRILKHTIQLTKYMTSPYFAGLSLYCAESGSLALCTTLFLRLPSDPTVTSNALAVLDCLPLGRGDTCMPQAGFASYAGQTKKASIWMPLNQLKN